jgi:hypothetical protein
VQSHNPDAAFDSVMRDVQQFGQQLLEAHNDAVLQFVRAVATHSHPA